DPRPSLKQHWQALDRMQAAEKDSNLLLCWIANGAHTRNRQPVWDANDFWSQGKRPSVIGLKMTRRVQGGCVIKVPLLRKPQSEELSPSVVAQRSRLQHAAKADH